MAAKTKPLEKSPGLAYAKDAAAGRVVVGKLVRLACKRHLEDLKRYGSERSRKTYYFDARAAQHPIDFIERLCHHSKGEWAGQLMVLEPWQRFIVAAIFGWKRRDGTRRFRKVYLEVARKNGKSTFMAAIGNYLLVADGEDGAEVYAAATKKDQAKIIWEEAMRMVKRSPSLSKAITVFKHNLSIPATSSKFEPLSSDENTLDGLNPSGVVIDELHAHKTRDVYDVLDTATGARRQPLLISITTSGSSRKSVCWDERDYSRKVLEGHIDDGQFFAYVAELDEDDDWTDESCWAKANPNLGVSVKLDDLRAKAAKAKQSPASQNAFRRLHLDQWTEQVTRWIDLAAWDACAGEIEVAALRGRECFAGIDLSSSRDVSAVTLVFPPTVTEAEEEGETEAAPPLWVVLPFFFVPEDNMHARIRDDGVPFDAWVDAGLVEATPGNVIDQDFIRARINALKGDFEIREVAYDPWGAIKLATELTADGFTMVEFRQGFGSMSPAMKQTETLILQRSLVHDANAVLRWMMGNIATAHDPAGNIKPDKAKSSDRIDGVVALIMAVGRASLNGGSMSIYEERGLLEVEL